MGEQHTGEAHRVERVCPDFRHVRSRSTRRLGGAGTRVFPSLHSPEIRLPSARKRGIMLRKRARNRRALEV